MDRASGSPTDELPTDERPLDDAEAVWQDVDRMLRGRAAARRLHPAGRSRRPPT